MRKTQYTYNFKCGRVIQTLQWGGNIDYPAYTNDEKELNNLIQRINKKNPNFVQRLQDPDRKHIQNWTNPRQISTHKLSWYSDGDAAIIVPDIKEIDGKLVDFTRPPYLPKSALHNAIRSNDTIMTNPKMANEFTTRYKEYYPSFNK